jgi:hypothetical protein
MSCDHPYTPFAVQLTTNNVLQDFVDVLIAPQAPPPTGLPRLPECQPASDTSIWLADNINTQYKKLIQAGSGNATVTTTLLQVMLCSQAARVTAAPCLPYLITSQGSCKPYSTTQVALPLKAHRKATPEAMTAAKAYC